MDISLLQKKYEILQQKITEKKKRFEKQNDNTYLQQANEEAVSLLENGHVEPFSQLHYSWKTLYYAFAVNEYNTQPHEFQEDLQEFMKDLIPPVINVHNLYDEVIDKYIDDFHHKIENATLADSFFDPWIRHSKRLSTIFEEGEKRILTKEKEEFLTKQYKNFFKAAVSLFFDSSNRFESSMIQMSVATFQIEIYIRNQVLEFFNQNNLTAYFGASLAKEIQKELQIASFSSYEQVSKIILPTENLEHYFHLVLFAMNERSYLIKQHDKTNFLTYLQQKFLDTEEAIGFLLNKSETLNGTELHIIYNQQQILRNILNCLLPYEQKEGNL